MLKLLKVLPPNDSTLNMKLLPHNRDKNRTLTKLEKQWVREVAEGKVSSLRQVLVLLNALRVAPDDSKAPLSPLRVYSDTLNDSVAFYYYGDVIAIYEELVQFRALLAYLDREQLLFVAATPMSDVVKVNTGKGTWSDIQLNTSKSIVRFLASISPSHPTRTMDEEMYVPTVALRAFVNDGFLTITEKRDRRSIRTTWAIGFVTVVASITSIVVQIRATTKNSEPITIQVETHPVQTDEQIGKSELGPYSLQYLDSLIGSSPEVVK